MNTELQKRFESAVTDMNNFCTGIFELPENVELSEDMEICAVDLDVDGVVLVTPKHSIWGNAYDAHKFRFAIEDLADSVVLQLAEILENEVRERAAWWELEERQNELPWAYN